jgi:conjugal transfer pilin signal peptidase TrbI
MVIGTLVLATIAIAAIYNLRIGFGAQSIDCIDGFVHIVRMETPGKVERGDLIVFIAPEQMGDRFKGHLAIKQVGAVAGDHVKVDRGDLYINGFKIGKLDISYKAAEYLHVPESSFERFQIIPKGFVLALGTKPRSFDGRYWGLLPVSNVVGSAYGVF